MSKKIIYLLSLLMALSLVFASCKKNSGTDSLGDIGAPDEEDNTGGLIEESGDKAGLITDDSFKDLPADKPLKKVTIFKGDANNYLRNPVVVVMGKNRNTPVVFAEKRYAGPGAANDVGIDGKATVDVVYKVGSSAGQNFGAETIVGAGASGPENAHGDPVVFRVSDTQVVVVATSGGGIARTDQLAADKTASRIEYIVGTFNGTTFTWDTVWTELKINDKPLLDTVKGIKTGNENLQFDQISVQAARGYVANSKLILPVIMAQQGKLGDGNVKELMGVYWVQGTVSGSSVTWANLEAEPYLAFSAKPDAYYSKYKATQVIGLEGTTVKFIAAPSPWGSPVTANYGLGDGKSAQPTETQIKGHDGAPGYLALKWYGAGTYTASTYMTDNQNPDKALFLGPKNDAKNITLYLVNKDTLAKEGKADGFELNAIGKSGSIDVLGDGTVVTAAEEGNNGERNYYTSFTRYSQSYLNSVLAQ